MYIIGVYGRSGAGKSTLSKQLAKDLNATYLEVDKYWKLVYYSNEFQKIVVPFFKKDKNLKKPENAVDDGTVRLKDLDVSARQAQIMRKLLFQYLNYRVNRKLRKAKPKIIVIDHINFFKFDVFKKSNFVVFVNTPAKVCQQNIMKRDYITQERMEHLLDEKIVERHDDFDLVLHNFEISAFDNNFEKDYEQLVELIKTDLKNKKQEKTSKIAKIFKNNNHFFAKQQKSCVNTANQNELKKF